MNELNVETKDSLTESDIEAIEEKLMNQFNSQLTKFVDHYTESPPKSVEQLRLLNEDFNTLFNLFHSTISTMENLRKIKID